MREILARLFPRAIDNEFPGVKLALWVFYPFVALTLWRSQHHIFSTDGGAQSIATIPLDTYPSVAANTIIGIFALWGLSQLVIGLMYLIAAMRYRALIPLLYLFAALEYAVRAFYISTFKTIETAGTAPGAAANLPLPGFAFVMLVLTLWPTKRTAQKRMPTA